MIRSLMTFSTFALLSTIMGTARAETFDCSGFEFTGTTKAFGYLALIAFLLVFFVYTPVKYFANRSVAVPFAFKPYREYLAEVHPFLSCFGSRLKGFSMFHGMACVLLNEVWIVMAVAGFYLSKHDAEKDISCRGRANVMMARAWSAAVLGATTHFFIVRKIFVKKAADDGGFKGKHFGIPYFLWVLYGALTAVFFSLAMAGLARAHEFAVYWILGVIFEILITVPIFAALAVFLWKDGDGAGYEKEQGPDVYHPPTAPGAEA